MNILLNRYLSGLLLSYNELYVKLWYSLSFASFKVYSIARMTLNEAISCVSFKIANETSQDLLGILKNSNSKVH